jgi:hypothetical protein
VIDEFCGLPKDSGAKSRDTLNYTEKFRGIYTVGWKYRRKTPNTVGKTPTVGIILRPRPITHGNFLVLLLTFYFKKTK